MDSRRWPSTTDDSGVTCSTTPLASGPRCAMRSTIVVTTTLAVGLLPRARDAAHGQAPVSAKAGTGTSTSVRDMSASVASANTRSGATASAGAGSAETTFGGAGFTGTTSAAAASAEATSAGADAVAAAGAFLPTARRTRARTRPAGAPMPGAARRAPGRAGPILARAERVVDEVDDRTGVGLDVVGLDVRRGFSRGDPGLAQVERDDGDAEGHVLHRLVHRRDVVEGVQRVRGQRDVGRREHVEDELVRDAPGRST